MPYQKSLEQLKSGYNVLNVDTCKCIKCKHLVIELDMAEKAAATNVTDETEESSDVGEDLLMRWLENLVIFILTVPLLQYFKHKFVL